MINNEDDLQGREIIVENEQGTPAIQHNICGRCRSKIERWMKSPSRTYCWSCFQMGTITDKSTLKAIPETNEFRVADKILNWEGKLTLKQAEIAALLCEEETNNQLVHAVTGAGKTEMLYPVINQSLKARKRVAFVAPRVDVVHEISKRLSTIFNVAQTEMTGDTPDPKEHHQLVFSTIHQLFKFKEAFDLIIIDECDAFPLYGNSWLQGAIQKACRDSGRLICLTATLPRGLEKAYDIKPEHKLSLYKRFHGYALPNLQVRYYDNWRKKCPDDLKKILLESDVPILLFVPKVEDCIQQKKYLEQLLNKAVGVAYAGKENRMEDIERFKSGEIAVLITTILLERGITFPNIDVVILGAEDNVFSAASLIQIAGRCGRTIERPTGNVYVYTAWKMRKIKKAIDEINRMNR